MRAHVIENGVVTNTIEVAALDVLPGVTLTDASLGGQIGDTYSGGVYSPPVVPLADRKAVMKTDITAKRYEVETGGTTVNGAAIQTDAGSQAKLSGALQLVQADDTVIVDWKGSAGWVQLNAAAVTAIATAVGLHVQAAFSREKAIHDAIEAAADFAALDLIDVDAGSINGSGSW